MNISLTKEDVMTEEEKKKVTPVVEEDLKEESAPELLQLNEVAYDNAKKTAPF